MDRCDNYPDLINTHCVHVVKYFVPIQNKFLKQIMLLEWELYMLIAALFTITKEWNHLKCTGINEWLQKT